MKQTKKIIVISSISAAVILGMGFIIVTGRPHVPKAFFEQRISAGNAAKHMSQLVSDSYANLEQVALYDKAGGADKALEIVGFERNNQQEKQNAAVLLSGSLEAMARQTQDIRPAEARQLSVEAVTAGVAMVSHIINYNANMDILFEALSIKFKGQYYNGTPIKDLVDNVNNEAKSINELSQRFNAALETFDAKYVN